MPNKPLAVQLGEFVAALRFDALPPEVVDKTKALVNHGVTVAMVGNASPRAVSARNAVLQNEGLGSRKVGAGQGATLWVDGTRATRVGAVFSNGVAMAAEDSDQARKSFIERVAKPRRTIYHGQSYGGLVGAKLIERFIPQWDLTHIVDASGAYIPGHGTPTVILFGRNQPPVRDTVRAVMGIRGEPTPPPNPAEGIVWLDIKRNIERNEHTSEWTSTSDTRRASFHRFPWSLCGGGASALKDQLEETANGRLSQHVSSIGFMDITSEDDRARIAEAGNGSEDVDLSKRAAQGP